MRPLPHLHVANLLLAATLLTTSCSILRRPKVIPEDSPLSLKELPSGDGETSVARLKEIADSPEAHLRGRESSPESGSDDSRLEFASADPVKVDSVPWSDNGFDSRMIEIGDVFSDHQGPILRKVASIAETLDELQKATWLETFALEKTRRVPLTLSPGEIAEIKEQLPPDTALPTRNVALDFRTSTRSTQRSRLERQLTQLANGQTPSGIPESEAKVIQSQFASVKTRLQQGEPLFVIIGVTETPSIQATYPGAPVGSRDADLIRNAFAALYPHLDQLKATKLHDQIVISRDPKIYWEFEARELKWKGQQLSIEPLSLARN